MAGPTVRSPSAGWRRNLNEARHIVFADDGAYTLAFDGDTWSLSDRLTDTTPDVTVTTTGEAWTRYLMTPPPDRPSAPPGVELTGHRQQVDRLRRLLARFPEGDE